MTYYTMPVIFSVPAKVANQGVYVAIFGDSGLAGPQVYLSSGQLDGEGNTKVLNATLSGALSVSATTITINESLDFPAANGSLLLTQTDAHKNITAQQTVNYAAYFGSTFTGVTGLSQAFAAGSRVSLDIAWNRSGTLPPNKSIPLLNLFPSSAGPYTGTVSAIVDVPGPGQTNVNGIPTTDIYSGELVMFVGGNCGMVPNAAIELVVPTLSTNPNDTFGLFEWGLVAADTNAGFIDYDVSAIDQVGFPFQVTCLMPNSSGPASPPAPPFDQGVGFLQGRKTLFDNFTPWLKGLSSASNALPFISLAPENSLFSKRITAPQDYLNFVMDSGPAFPEAAPGINGLQPIQYPAGQNNYTYSVNPQSVAIQTAGSGYSSTSLPTLSFSAPPPSKTATTAAASVTQLTSSGGLELAGIDVSNVGSGYTAAPNITVSAPPTGGKQAAVAIGLAPVVTYYAITAMRIDVKVNNKGSGYQSPSVTFSAPPSGGTTATGVAVLGTGDEAGQIIGIYLTDYGSGYTSAPTVSITDSQGTGATATATLVESMTGPIQQAQVNCGTVAVVNWLPYPCSCGYNVYRSSNANMSGAVLLNTAPIWPVTLAAGSTLNAGVQQSTTSLTVTSPTAPANLPQTGTLLIDSGCSQGFFQYTSASSSSDITTFTGTMVAAAGFTANIGTAVMLLPNFSDDGISGTAQTPPANNYNYEPLARYFTAAIKDFFDYYRPTAQGGSGTTFEIDLAGTVGTKWTGQTEDLTINGNTYTVLNLTGETGTYGGLYAGYTAYIYQPFFSSNVVAGILGKKVTLPPPPAWLTSPSESPSSMVFGADGVFSVPDNSNIPTATVNGSLSFPLPTGNVTITASAPTMAFPSSGQLLVVSLGNTNQVLAYTGTTTTPTTVTFTGVSFVSGSNSGTFSSATVFADSGQSFSTAPTAIVKDIMNPINAALNRGLTPRLSGSNWTNALAPDYWAQAPLFPLTATVAATGGSLANGTYYYAITGVNVNSDTSGAETIPGNIVTVTTGTSGSGTNTVTLTIPNTGVTTFGSFNVYRGTSPTTLLKIDSTTSHTYTDDGSKQGTTSPPTLMNADGQTVNWYAAYLHRLSVSINGFAYGTPYDDQGSFSTNVNLIIPTTLEQSPQSLTITLNSWDD